MTADFRKLLDRDLTTIERPKAYPPGTYYGAVLRHEMGESPQKKTPFVSFFTRVAYPGDDVDPELLNGIEVGKKEFRKDFYLTEDSLYRIKDFLASCGIEGTLATAIAQTTGTHVVFSLRQRTLDDGAVVNDVGDFKAVA